MALTIGQEFLMKTKFVNLCESDRDKKVPKPPFELSIDENYPIIDLPDAKNVSVNSINVKEAIEQRTSIRDYANRNLTLEELSYLLWCTQGVKRIIPDIVALRNVPSAGARNAFETYLLINRIEGLDAGLYKYIAIGHKLAKLEVREDMDNEFMTACDDQDYVKNSAVTFFWTAYAYRMTWSYGERGYRYLFIDAGHVCQNLYLSAEAINVGVCAIGHFDDDKLSQLLHIDGIEQFPVYVASAGRKEQNS